ncbi:MAG: tail fiber domain-containing protein [Saprospiraceae bacterium]|nr:tail fiber domain-containing protein [Saprospiraceae bacterium]
MKYLKLLLNTMICLSLAQPLSGQRVMVEKYDPASDTSYTLGVASQDMRSLDIKNTYAGSNVAYGQHILMTGSGDGGHYASYQEINSQGAGDKFGSYHKIIDSTAWESYGSYNHLSGPGLAKQYGTFNYLSGGGQQTRTGTFNDILSSATYNYGTINRMRGGGLNRIGSEQHITSNETGTLTGSRNVIDGDGGGTHYGTYNLVSTTGAGTRCAGWFSAYGGNNNYAAIFYSGDVMMRSPSSDVINFYSDYDLARIGIGTDAPSTRLEVVDDLFNGAIVAIVNESTNSLSDGMSIQAGPVTNPGATTQYIMFRDGNGTLLASITGNGSGGVNYNTTSDFRLKQDIRPYTTGLDLVQSMQPRIYERISKPGEAEIGFIAQELQKVLPQAVSGSPDSPVDEPMMVDYSKITPVLVSAVQQLSEELAVQRELNDQLLQRVAALEQQAATKAN